MTPRRSQILQRAGLVLGVGVVAAFSLSSSVIASIVGALTILVVLFDMQTAPSDLEDEPPVARATRWDSSGPTSMEPTPQHLTIDLTRRR